MLREQLLETQQAKVDGELSLLTEKRELLQELQVLKVRSCVLLLAQFRNICA